MPTQKETTFHTYWPNAKQALFHAAPQRYKLYGGAYGGGKTACLVNEGIQLSLEWPGNRGFIGCKHLTDFKSNALLQLAKFLPEVLYKARGVHHQTDHYYRLNNASVIMYGGLGNDIEAIQAISNMPELGWFAIDQAEQISETQFQLLCGRLRLNIPGIRYYGLLTANPSPGWLRDTFIENADPEYIYIPALPADNKENLAPDYEEQLRKQYPPEMVKRLLEGNWDIDLSGDYLFPYRLIRDAVNRNLQASGDKVAGVDIARKGGDETVFIVRQGDKVLYLDGWAFQETQWSAGRIARLIREHKPAITNIDIGYAPGVYETLKREGFAVAEVNLGEKALDSEKYMKRRAEYYYLLAKKFEEGTIDIPDNTKLTSQLASIKYDFRETRMIIESKEKMRRHGVHSPDYADALMLAFIDTGTKAASKSIVRYF